VILRPDRVLLPSTRKLEGGQIRLPMQINRRGRTDRLCPRGPALAQGARMAQCARRSRALTVQEHGRGQQRENLARLLPAKLARSSWRRKRRRGGVVAGRGKKRDRLQTEKPCSKRTLHSTFPYHPRRADEYVTRAAKAAHWGTSIGTSFCQTVRRHIAAANYSCPVDRMQKPTGQQTLRATRIPRCRVLRGTDHRRSATRRGSGTQATFRPA